MLKREKYIDGVIGPQSYHNISEAITGIEKKRERINATDFEVIEKFDKLNYIKNSSSKISSFLTIQEGCDKFCKFCVVPYTRGPEYSRPFSQIIDEAKQLILNGVKEITLLGQNVNAYNSQNKKLSDIIHTLNSIKGIERIRYTTSHPKDVSDDLIDAHGECDKLMPLLHLPVQSGSSKILKSMNRKHDLEFYLEITEKLLKKNSLIKFSSDFIIGYPGEENQDFDDTLMLMKKVKFINSYSFIYSARPGTPAADLDAVETKIAKERLSIFQKLADETKKDYRKNILGTVVKVLFENKSKNSNNYFGRDEYANSVIVESKNDLTGKIFYVEIKEYNSNTLFGELHSRIKKDNVAA